MAPSQNAGLLEAVFAHWTSNEGATPVPASSKALERESQATFTLVELVVRSKGILPP